MKFSHVAMACLVGGAFAVPVASPQEPSDFDAAIDAALAMQDAPAEGAPANDPLPPTDTYDQAAAIGTAVAVASDVMAELLSATVTATDAPAPTATSKRRSPVEKRGACDAYSPGNGPAIHSPADDITSFYNDPSISAAASGASEPAGYEISPGYVNLIASVESPSYLTFTTDGLTSYDPSVCAAKCNSITGCVSFNIFFERNPTVDANKPSCPNPPSLTRIKCSFFGTHITIAEATNLGGWQADFHVVIAGSNTYTKPPPAIDGFVGPTYLGNSCIMSPTVDNTYMRVQTFPQTQPYDPSVCAAACKEMTAYAGRHDSTRFCKFFDAYILYKNNANGVFTCTYYTAAYGPEYAKNKGQYRGSDHYTIGTSNTYTVV